MLPHDDFKVLHATLKQQQSKARAAAELRSCLIAYAQMQERLAHVDKDQLDQKTGDTHTTCEASGCQATSSLRALLAEAPAKPVEASTSTTDTKPPRTRHVPLRLVPQTAKRPVTSWCTALLVALSITLYVAPAAGADTDVGVADYTTGPKGFRVTGANTYEQQVSGLGDVNGDGIDDFACASRTGFSLSGTVTVIYGHSTATPFPEVDARTNSVGSAGFTIIGASSGDNLGNSIAAAGDVNGDGIDDMIVGARAMDYATAGDDVGAAYVIFGRPLNNPFPSTLYMSTFVSGSSSGFKITGAPTDYYVGYTVAGAGDMNKDGFSDVMVATPWRGVIYIILGHSTGTAFPAITAASFVTGTVGFKLTLATNELLGWSAGGGGDANGDGYDDVIISALYSSKIYVFLGHSGTFTDENLATFTTGAKGFVIVFAEESHYGDNKYVDFVGDINHDGYDDMVVGSPLAVYSGRQNAGTIYVVFGRSSVQADIVLATMVYGTLGFRIYGGATNTFLGNSVSGAGDVNADGIQDLLVGNMYDRSGVETAIIIYGHSNAISFSDVDTNALTVPGFQLYGGYYQFGCSVSAAGDVNHDGIDDFVVGANGNGYSAAYAVFGFSTAPTKTPTLAPTALPTTAPTGPTSQPSAHPSSQPSEQPSARPSKQPAARPTSQPSCRPSRQPSGQPSVQPAATPSAHPSSQPVRLPTSQPSRQPSSAPSTQPSRQPSRQPTMQPTRQPSSQPSRQPAAMPSGQPTSQPSRQPSSQPSRASTDLDMAGAAYTSGTKGFRVAGTASNDQYGSTVSGLGDVNGDGIDDFAVGSKLAAVLSRIRAGAVMVIYGRSTATPFAEIDTLTYTFGTGGFKICGVAEGSEFGRSVAGAGDVNGDGIGDIIVGAIGIESADMSNVDAYVIFGRPLNNPFPASIDLASFASGSTSGFKIIIAASTLFSWNSVSSAGDLNGDGFADVVIGSNDATYLTRGQSGTTYVIFGHSSTSAAFADINDASFASGAEGFKIYGAANSVQAGTAVSGGGDVNGDGHDDISLSAFSANPLGRSVAGIAYVLFGHSGAFADIDLLTFTTGPLGYRILGALANVYMDLANIVGDLNHDGFDDLVITSYRSPYLDRPNAGIAYVIFGRRSVTADIDLLTMDYGTLGFRVYGGANSYSLGRSAHGAGDINGDGVADLVIGQENSAYLSRGNSGSAIIVYGHSNQSTFPDIDTAYPLGELGFRLYGAASSDQFGFSVQAAGDVNNDGADDLIVGAYRATAGARTAAGAAYIVFGGGTGAFPSKRPSLHPTPFPTFQLTPQPSGQPSQQPSSQPSRQPHFFPSSAPTKQPNGAPTAQPTGQPSSVPSTAPSGQSSAQPIDVPSKQPTALPSRQPTTRPSRQPSVQPSEQPSAKPSQQPQMLPSCQPSRQPSRQPTTQPTRQPSSQPSRQPAATPSGQPTIQPSRQPSSQPSRAITDIDMAGAAYTSGTKGFRVLGTADDDLYGSAVSGLGDVNGDGIGDFATASPFADILGRIDAGCVMVIYGHSTAAPFPEIDPLTYTFGASGFIIYGAAADAGLGKSIAGAGDVNGDGVSDILIGATGVESVGMSDGDAYVIFGRPLNNPFPASIDLASFVSGSTSGFKIVAAAATLFLNGNAVSGAGDFNGDGFSDVVIGCYDATYLSRNPAGTTYVIFGRNNSTAFTNVDAATFAPGTVGFRIYGAASGNRAGAAVSGGGDVNGDGHDDIAFVAFSASPPGRPSAGIAYVVYGRSASFADIDLLSFTTGAEGCRILGAYANDRIGLANVVGDLNHDGFDDVVVASAGSMYLDRTNAGIAYVIFGRRTITADIDLLTMDYGTLGFRVYGGANSYSLGRSAHGTGDINGDGVADLVIGQENSAYLSRGNSGSAIIVYGHSNQSTFPDIDTAYPLGELGFRLYGAASGDQFGNNVQAAGDVNNDGADDLIVGAYRATTGARTASGAAYIVFGGGAGAFPTKRPSIRPSPRPTSQPTSQPSARPSQQPSSQPSSRPQSCPSSVPSAQPNVVPSSQPSTQPSSVPSAAPSVLPTVQPTSVPSQQPTGQPSCLPTVSPSTCPSGQPSPQPSTLPTTRPSTQPSSAPSAQPVKAPSALPSVSPTTQPSVQPSALPTGQPIMVPTSPPSVTPTTRPSAQPRSDPTSQPSVQPTRQPASAPSNQPSRQPTAQPSRQPSRDPTSQPLLSPTSRPSSQPAGEPTSQPSAVPSRSPSAQPASTPSVQPSVSPSDQPSCGPTGAPSGQPLSAPSSQPSSGPSAQPSARPSRQLSSAPTTWLEGPDPNVATNATIVSAFPRRTHIELKVTVLGRAGAVVRCAAFQSTTQRLNSLQDIYALDQSGVYVSPGEQKSVMVPRLLPYTYYDIYCTAVTLLGTEMSLATVRQGRRTVRTECCKTITVSLSTSSLLEHVVMQNGLSFIYDAAPSVNASLQFAFHASVTQVSAVHPSRVVLHSSMVSVLNQPQYYSVIAGGVGSHTLEVELTGPSAAEFNVTYQANRRTLTVLAAESEPPIPKLMSAIFSDAGSAVILSFDAPTNKGGYFNAFPCTKLLNFSGNTAASCQWTDSSTIAVYPLFAAKDPFKVLRIGSLIQLKPGIIRAACTGTNITRCQSWSSVALAPLGVAKPLSPVQPTVVMSMPATLSACSSLTVDLTGSTGGAGRPWNSTRFTVRTTPGGTAAALQLEAYLRANFTLNPPTAVPHTAFQKGFTYSIQATMCNFLGSCASAVKSVTVLASPIAVPTVSILGPSQRSVYRFSQLVLSAQAYTQSCHSVMSSAGLQFEWSVRRVLSNGTQTVTNLRPSSQNPAVFRLPAYSLAASARYEVELSVRAAGSVTTVSTTVSVQVLQGSVVAAVLGGSSKQLAVGDTIQLDATQSYDEDVPNQRGQAAGLQFQWTCVQTMPVFRPECEVIMSDAQQEKVTVRAPASAINTTSLFTVTVASGERKSTAQVKVTMSGATMPVLEILNDAASLSNINPGKQLVLQGSLQLQSPCVATWSVDDQSVLLSRGARTPVSNYVEANPLNAVSILLLLTGYTLPQRSTLVFALTCGSTSTSVAVLTNGAPLPGDFSVSPQSGDELSTVFTFAAMQWSDSELPLTYQFGFQTATINNLVVAGRSEKAFSSTPLPAGDVVCTMHVYDAIGASAGMLYPVLVRSVTAAAKDASLLQLLDFSTENIDVAKNIISVLSAALHSVNCSAALNCSSLHRSPCGKTSGECGPCLGGYSGDAGDRSTLCIPAVEAWASSASQACQIAGDCPFSWQVCDDATSTCVAPPKSCSRNCSSHGECIYVNKVTGAIQPDCRLDDLNCEGVCSCADLYSGALCEISVAALRNRRGLRTRLISGLRNATTNEDVTAEAVAAWSASLHSLSINPYELSTKDVSTVAEIASAALHSAIALDVEEYVDLEGVLQAIDAGASLLRYNYNPNDYDDRSFNVTREYQNNTAAAMIPIVSAFGDLVARSMVLGQNSTTILYDNFRLSVEILPTAGNISVDSPQSDQEKLSGAPLSTVQLTTAAGAAPSDALEVKVVAVNPRSYSSDTSAFVSSPLLLQVQTRTDNGTRAAATSRSVTSMVCTLRHIEQQYQYLHYVPANFTTVCSERNESELHSFVCPDSGHVLTHNCSQGAGVYTSYCPKPTPACAKLSIDSAEMRVTNGCTAASYNATYTTCTCVTKNAAELEEPLLDDTGAVNIVVTTAYYVDGSADSFQAATGTATEDSGRVLVVFIILGALWVPALLFLGIDWLRPRRSKKVKQSPMSGRAAQNILSAYIDSTIPGVFRTAAPGWSPLLNEIINHHQFFRVFAEKDTVQRRLAVARTLTVLTFLLFLATVLFDAANPGDDDSCDNYSTEESCLERTSSFDHDQTYCHWNSDTADQTESPCSYRTEAMSTTALFYIAVLAAVIVAIATIPVDYLFGIISAPTARSAMGSKVADISGVTGKALSDEVIQLGDAACASVVALIEKNSQAMIQQSLGGQPLRLEPSAEEGSAEDVRMTEKAALVPNSSNLGAQPFTVLSPLCRKVIQQRAMMNDGTEESKVFDEQWGVLKRTATQEGPAYYMRQHTLIAIDEDCLSVRREVGAVSKLLPNYSVHHAGLEILHLFMVDLLGRKTAAAKIYKEKVGEEFGRSQTAGMAQKICAAGLLLALNALFVYLILLKAFDKGYEWQMQYLVCCAVLLAIEVLLYETTECVWLHYSVPMCVHKEVAAAVQKLRAHVERVTAPADELSQLGHGYQAGYFLNAPAHLFASTQVAKGLPLLLESMIVSSYSHHLPGEISRTWRHIPSKSSLVLQTIAAVPYKYQRILVRCLQPIILCVIALLWFAAVGTPLYVFILCAVFALLLVYAMYRLCRTNKAASQAQNSVVPVSQANTTIPTFIHHTSYDEGAGILGDIQKHRDADAIESVAKGSVGEIVPLRLFEESVSVAPDAVADKSRSAETHVPSECNPGPASVQYPDSIAGQEINKLTTLQQNGALKSAVMINQDNDPSIAQHETISSDAGNLHTRVAATQAVSALFSTVRGSIMHISERPRPVAERVEDKSCDAVTVSGTVAENSRPSRSSIFRAGQAP